MSSKDGFIVYGIFVAFLVIFQTNPSKFNWPYSFHQNQDLHLAYIYIFLILFLRI